MLAAVTPTVSGLLAPLFGRLADRVGPKMMLIRSLAAFTVIKRRWPLLLLRTAVALCLGGTLTLA